MKKKYKIDKKGWKLKMKKKKLIFSLYSFQLSNIKVCVYINNAHYATI